MDPPCTPPRPPSPFGGSPGKSGAYETERYRSAFRQFLDSRNKPPDRIKVKQFTVDTLTDSIDSVTYRRIPGIKPGKGYMNTILKQKMVAKSPYNMNTRNMQTFIKTDRSVSKQEYLK